MERDSERERERARESDRKKETMCDFDDFAAHSKYCQ